MTHQDLAEQIFYDRITPENIKRFASFKAGKTYEDLQEAIAEVKQKLPKKSSYQSQIGALARAIEPILQPKKNADAELIRPNA